MQVLQNSRMALHLMSSVLLLLLVRVVYATNERCAPPGRESIIIELQNCGLTNFADVMANIKDNFPKAETVNLVGNKFEIFDPAALKGTQIKNLILDHNDPMEVAAQEPSLRVEALRRLSMSHCKLGPLSENFTCIFPNLTELTLCATAFCNETGQSFQGRFPINCCRGPVTIPLPPPCTTPPPTTPTTPTTPSQTSSSPTEERPTASLPDDMFQNSESTGSQDFLSSQSTPAILGETPGTPKVQTMQIVFIAIAIVFLVIVIVIVAFVRYRRCIKDFVCACRVDATKTMQNIAEHNKRTVIVNYDGQCRIESASAPEGTPFIE